MTGLLLSNGLRTRSFLGSLISMAFPFADAVVLRVDVEEERDFYEDE